MSKSGRPGRPAAGGSASGSPPTVEIPVKHRNGQNGQPVNGRAAAPEHPLPSYPQPPVPKPQPQPEHDPRSLALLALVVLALLVAGGGLGAGYHVLKPPRFTASISEIVTVSSTTLTDPEADPTPQQRDVTTNVDLLSSALVEDRAEATAGTKLPKLQVTSRSDSNVVTAAVDAADRAAAADAVTAYVTAYEALLSAQQKAILTGERTRLAALQSNYKTQVSALDSQLAAASTARKQILVQAQAPRRQSLAASSDDVANRLSRVTETLRGLPATTQRLDAKPVTKSAGTALPMDVATGVVIGAIAAGALLWRRFRPRFS
ncbi:hypothetical protein ACIB24_21040 [Spongisporangium articulatum]|uniref:Uncharacterized protein n=1 Tax=Spongisporangium articulatum TaxID=3362603 RepID=A0ABW8AT31_9ACTN